MHDRTGPDRSLAGNEHDDMERAGEHLEHAGEHASEAAHHADEAGRHASEALQAGASGTLERTRDAAREVGSTALDAASNVAGAAAGTARAAGSAAGSAARATVDGAASVAGAAAGAAGSAAHAAAGAVKSTVQGAGHAASSAAGAVAGTFSAVAGMVGTMANRIAAQVGGWWTAAREAVPEVPTSLREACSMRYESGGSRSLAAEEAHAAFALGYMAAQYPGYRGRTFSQVEADVRHGYPGDQPGYDSWREYTQFGYERGSER